MEERLAEILGEWRERCDRGEVSNGEDLIAAHPDLADDLRRRLWAMALLDLDVGTEPDETLPEFIGEFRIVREVGRGGMAVVYEAEQKTMGRRVALKVLPPSITATRESMRRFRQEALAAGRLSHTNLVTIHQMGEENGYCYYAMELVRGAPLDSVVAERKRLLGSPTGTAGRSGSTSLASTSDRPFFLRAAEAFAQVADALHLTHEHGIVHRDVKPSNLILDEDGTLKVTDFGLARIEGDDGALTRTGSVIGTPLYMSPEQAAAQRDKIDRRTDVYSLGATLYELLTLRPPHAGDDFQTIRAQILSEEPIHPRRIDRRIPADLATIVMKALEKKRSARYATADELARDLRAFAAGRGIRARPVGPVGRTWRRIKRRKVRASLAAAVVLLGIAALVFGIDSARESERRALLEYAQLCARGHEALVRHGPDTHGDLMGDDIEGIFRRAIEIAPERPEAWFGLALIGRRSSADREQDLATAEGRGLSARTISLARADLLRDAGKWSEARAALDEVPPEPNAPAADLYFEATIKGGFGVLPEAERLYTQAIDRAARTNVIRYLALHGRARLRTKLRRWTEALEDYLAMRAAGDDSIRTQVRIASVWRRLGEETRARETFDRAHDEVRALAVPVAWHELGSECANCGQRDWQNTVTQEAVEAFPNSVPIVVNRVRYLEHARDHEARLALTEALVKRVGDDWLALRAYAGALRANARVKEAIPVLEKVLTLKPRDHESSHALAVFYLSGQDTGRALEQIEHAIDTDPRCVLARLLRADCLRRLHRYGDALEEIDRALGYGDEAARAHWARAQIYQEQDQPEMALKAVQCSLAIDPTAFEARFIEATLLHELKRYGEAETAYRSLIPDAPNSIRIDQAQQLRHMLYRNLSLSCFRLGKSAACVEAVREMRKLGPVGPRILNVYGASLADLQELDEAQAVLEETLRLRPGYALAHYNLSMTFRYRKDYAAALRQLNLAIQNGLEVDADVAFERAECLGLLGEHEEAIESARESAQLDPKLETAWLRWWESLVALEREADALDVLRKGVAKCGAASLHTRLIRALGGRLGACEEVLAACRQAHHDHPDDPDFAGVTGSTLCRLGRLDESLEVFDDAVKRNGDNLRLQWCRADVLVTASRYEDALKALRGPAAGYDENAVAYLLSRALLSLGRFDHAVAAAGEQPLARGPKALASAHLGRRPEVDKILAAAGPDDLAGVRLGIHVLQGRHDEAIPIGRTLSKDGDVDFGVLFVEALIGAGRIGEAREEAARLAVDAPLPQERVNHAYLHAVAGHAKRAKSILAGLPARPHPFRLHRIAATRATLGDADGAVAALRAAVAAGYREPADVPLRPSLRSIEGDARLAPILKQMQR